MLKKLLLVIFYVIFGLVLTAVLLVFRFPKDSFLAFTVSKIEQELPGYSCLISGVTYHYPCGLHLDGVSFKRKSGLQQIRLSDVFLQIEPKSLMQRGSVGFDIFGGRVETEILLEHGSSIVELSRLNISHIDLARIEILAHELDRRISGDISFNGTFIGRRGELATGDLTGTIHVTNFNTELKRSVLMSNEVTFDRVESAVRLHDKMIELTGGKATGSMYIGDFNGNVNMRAGVPGGAVQISGSLSPTQDYIRKNRQVARAAALLYREYKNTRIPFHVTGSLQKPVFQFGGMKQ